MGHKPASRWIAPDGWHSTWLGRTRGWASVPEPHTRFEPRRCSRPIITTRIIRRRCAAARGAPLRRRAGASDLPESYLARSTSRGLTVATRLPARLGGLSFREGQAHRRRHTGKQVRSVGDGQRTLRTSLEHVWPGGAGGTAMRFGGTGEDPSGGPLPSGWISVPVAPIVFPVIGVAGVPPGDRHLTPGHAPVPESAAGPRSVTAPCRPSHSTCIPAQEPSDPMLSCDPCSGRTGHGAADRCRAPVRCPAPSSRAAKGSWPVEPIGGLQCSAR